jgi:hypothetical protein
MKTGSRILLLVALLAVPLWRATGASDFIAKLEAIPPFPSVRAAAKAKGIPFEGIDPIRRTQALFPGDSATALVTLHKKGREPTQWLICFQAAAESKAREGEAPHPETLYTSTGGKLMFAWHPAMLTIRTIGPFTAPGSSRRAPSLNDRSARITVNQTFLALGLDQAAAVLHRVFNSRPPTNGPTKFGFGISSKPFTSQQISRGRRVAAWWRITPEQERALAGGVPALLSFFNTVQKTPELESILLKVLSRPSIWSIVGHLGVSVNLAIGQPKDRVGPLHLADWGHPADSRLFSLPVEVLINKHHALTLTLVVTAPHPPLLTCGGIAGFLAENPDRQDNYLTLRVISAHCRASDVKAGQELRHMPVMSVACGLGQQTLRCPPPGSLKSPDGNWTLVCTNPKDHQFCLRLQGRSAKSMKLLEFDRDCEAFWSPDSKHIALTDAWVSDRSDVFIYAVSHPERKESLRPLFPQGAVPEADLEGHCHFEVSQWLDANRLQFKIEGHTDEAPVHGFEYTFVFNWASGEFVQEAGKRWLVH